MKLNLSPGHAMKASGGRGSIDRLLLKLNTGWRTAITALLPARFTIRQRTIVPIEHKARYQASTLLWVTTASFPLFAIMPSLDVMPFEMLQRPWTTLTNGICKTDCWIQQKSENKVIRIHAIKAYRSSGDTALFILSFDSRWIWVVSVTSWSLYHGDPGIRWIGGWVGRRTCYTYQRREKCLSLAGFKPRTSIP